MSSGKFTLTYQHTNPNAAWHTNPNAEFALPSEQVIFTSEDPYLNEVQFLEMVRRFFIASGYTEDQWVNALKKHIST